jgi:hypothetical protein
MVQHLHSHLESIVVPKIKYKEDSAAKKGATNDFDALVEQFRTKVK